MKKPSLTSNSIEELWTGSSLDLLKELHILTREGKLNQDSRRKLKQVYHLCQLIEPYLDEVFQTQNDPLIVDMGCGKSYLGFMLYDLFLKDKEGGRILGIDLREDLQKKSMELAKKSQFHRMSFEVQKTEDLIQNNQLQPHMVCALHACDTATDDALFYGIQSQAQAIVVVPCCQAEVARLLPSKEHLSSLWSYPLHAREFGSHLTNVLRVLILKSMGYAVAVTELVGWEHSMKNEIFLAKKTNPGNKVAKRQLQKLLEDIPVEPKLFRYLKDSLTP